MTGENFKYKTEKVDKEIYSLIKKRWDAIAKPIDGLGKFEEYICRIGAIQKSVNPRLTKAGVVVFCADNGIVDEGVSQSDQSVTALCAGNIATYKSVLGKFARMLDCNISVVDVGMAYDSGCKDVIDDNIMHSTNNFLNEPAMTKEQLNEAVECGIKHAYRMKEEGYDIVAAGEMGIGNTTTSAAVISALLKMPAKECAGRGAGLDDKGLRRKIEVIDEAVKKYDLYNKDVMDVMSCVGGLDIAAMAGFYIGAAMASLPVILDGVISMCAAYVAYLMCKGVKDYYIPSHASREKCARIIAKSLDVNPVIDADMAVGEGTGSLMMLSLLRMANEVYSDGTGFDDYGLEQYTRRKQC